MCIRDRLYSAVWHRIHTCLAPVCVQWLTVVIYVCVRAYINAHASEYAYAYSLAVTTL